jgi:multiple sugar transport system substrate-binding protein
LVLEPWRADAPLGQGGEMGDVWREQDEARTGLSRRQVLARGAGGAFGLSALSGLAVPVGALARAHADVGEVSVGSNASDAVPKAAFAKVFKAFEADSGGTVKVNTVAHGPFQEQINSYLQGRPDDVFTWFAGYRMQFFAKRGLVGDISDVWKQIGGNFSKALKDASTGEDGKQYFVPIYYYPWAVFYRPSVFKQYGWKPAKTWDQFIALCKQIQKDGKGMVPVAFADKDGWPAMGTFDYVNMRTNGYDFHISLMKGKEAWDSPKVKQVFKTWSELLPYTQPGALGRTWQEAAQSLSQKKAAMYVLGMFVGQQFTGPAAKDLDFFAFPSINNTYGHDSVEAPIDGFMMAKKPKNETGAKALLMFLASAKAENIYLKSDPNNIGANKKASTANYSRLQKKAVELISTAKHISQFLDRDTRPDFASTVMIPSLQTFLKSPKDVDGLTKSIERQKKSIFTS